MALAGLILGLAGVAPLFWQAVFEEKRSLIYVRYDPFVAYSPGELYGPSLNPLVRREGIPAKLQLPRSPIKVTDLNGNVISGSVYVLQVTIWNGGAKNINGDEIRQPLVVSIVGADKIIDTQILFADERNGLEVTRPEGILPSVKVTWRYFDRNAGLKLAVAFTAEQPVEPRAQVFFDGDLIEGNKPDIDRHWLRSSIVILCYVSIILSYSVVIRKLPGIWRAITFLVLVVIMLSASWWLAISISPSQPPF